MKTFRMIVLAVIAAIAIGRTCVEAKEKNAVFCRHPDECRHGGECVIEPDVGVCKESAVFVHDKSLLSEEHMQQLQIPKVFCVDDTECSKVCQKYFHHGSVAFHAANGQDGICSETMNTNVTGEEEEAAAADNVKKDLAFYCTQVDHLFCGSRIIVMTAEILAAIKKYNELVGGTSEHAMVAETQPVVEKKETRRQKRRQMLVEKRKPREMEPKILRARMEIIELVVPLWEASISTHNKKVEDLCKHLEALKCAKETPASDNHN
eukprot:GHVS01002422.1.p1 GENE.GHVS01002422.1~~GHVS01002422.1.p1  ORF type:complete len:264 (-),score=31.51 GHVS01002422.1:250-1041(-)